MTTTMPRRCSVPWVAPQIRHRSRSLPVTRRLARTATLRTVGRTRTTHVHGVPGQLQRGVVNGHFHESRGGRGHVMPGESTATLAVEVDDIAHAAGDEVGHGTGRCRGGMPRLPRSSCTPARRRCGRSGLHERHPRHVFGAGEHEVACARSMQLVAAVEHKLPVRDAPL